jgi:hypothetical protein
VSAAELSSRKKSAASFWAKTGGIDEVEIAVAASNAGIKRKRIGTSIKGYWDCDDNDALFTRWQQRLS